MDRFMAAVRRLFGRKEHEGENHNHSKLEEKKEEPNEFQKAERKQHPYDEVTLDEEGPPTVGASQPNEFQTPKRAPRSYEEVEIPVGGGVEVR